jgi:hypothetical protein
LTKKPAAVWNYLMMSDRWIISRWSDPYGAQKKTQ